MTIPTVAVTYSDATTDVAHAVTLGFSYSFEDPSTWTGQIALGFDQYAVYFAMRFSNGSDAGHYATGVAVTGPLPRAAYLSFKYEFKRVATPRVCPRELFGGDLIVSTVGAIDSNVTWLGGPNPYIPGNPSTLFYYTGAGTPSAAAETGAAGSAPEMAPASAVRATSNDGYIPVYRLDKVSVHFYRSARRSL